MADNLPTKNQSTSLTIQDLNDVLSAIRPRLKKVYKKILDIKDVKSLTKEHKDLLLFVMEQYQDYIMREYKKDSEDNSPQSLNQFNFNVADPQTAEALNGPINVRKDDD